MFLLVHLNNQIIFAAHLVFKVAVWLFQKLKGNQVKNLNSTRCCEYHILALKVKINFCFNSLSLKIKNFREDQTKVMRVRRPANCKNIL